MYNIYYYYIVQYYTNVQYLLLLYCSGKVFSQTLPLTCLLAQQATAIESITPGELDNNLQQSQIGHSLRQPPAGSQG